MITNAETKQFIVVKYHNFEEFVNGIYGFPQGTYSFVADEECGNESDHAYMEIDNEPLDKYDAERMESFVENWGNDDCYMATTILRDLCIKGFIEAGNYLIRVNW